MPSTVNFVLLILSFFIFVAVILTILLDRNKQKITQFDVTLDIVLVDNNVQTNDDVSTNRTVSQYKLWKQLWKSKENPRFLIFHRGQTSSAPNFFNDEKTNNNDITLVHTQDSERDLFTHVSHFMTDTENRKCVWASDNVVPLVPFSARTFQVPNSHLLRYFGGKTPDAFITGVESEFKPILPISLFNYSDLQNTTMRDIELSLMHHPKMCYSHIYQNIVLTHSKDDESRLKERRVDELFQIVHVSPHHTDPSHANTLICQHWQSVLAKFTK
jgi:hypothetical protein